MADFSFITSRIATGAAINSPDDVNQLVKAGITHIIDCRGEFDDTPLLASHPSISYLWNGTDDDGQPKPEAWFYKSFEFALPVLALPDTKLYAHCAAGINRGPSTAYAIIRSIGLLADEVLNLIHTERPQTKSGVRYAPDADKALLAFGWV